MVPVIEALASFWGEERAVLLRAREALILVMAVQMTVAMETAKANVMAVAPRLPAALPRGAALPWIPPRHTMAMGGKTSRKPLPPRQQRGIYRGEAHTHTPVLNVTQSFWSPCRTAASWTGEEEQPAVRRGVMPSTRTVLEKGTHAVFRASSPVVTTPALIHTAATA